MRQGQPKENGKHNKETESAGQQEGDMMGWGEHTDQDNQDTKGNRQNEHATRTINAND